jgi:hypothetical protein
MGISVQYSNLAKQVCMSMIYIPIFPLGVPITLFGIILNYFVEKFKCIYVYKRPEMLNQSICFFYMDYFCVALFCYAIGDYIFFSDTHSNKFFELFNIIFYAILFIIPYNILLRKWNSSASDKYENLIPYDEAYFGFSFDYERINPKTQKKGMIEYLERLYEKELIEKDDLEYCKNNIDKINLRETFYMNSRTKTNNVMKLNNIDNYNENKNPQKGFQINQFSEEQHVNAENDIHVNAQTKNNIRNFMNNFQFLIEQKELCNIEEQQENPNNIDNDNKVNNIQPKFIQNIGKPRFRPFEFNSKDLFNKKRERKNKIWKKMSKK